MIHELMLIAAALTSATTKDSSGSIDSLRGISESVSGRVGICVFDLSQAGPDCIRGDERFPLQSVMKLVVSAAVLDAVDQKKLSLTDTLELTPNQASPGPQEFADLIRKQGSLKVTVEELIRRSIVDSDSTSIDVLIARIGGLSVVQDFLKRKKVEGVRIDRNERDLQAEFHGLAWKADYADEKVFNAAVKAASDKVKDKALAAYSKDARDTTTPEGMVHFLKDLNTGKLLSSASTAKLLSIMNETVTGQDRLKAGLPSGWTLAHKTGTSANWKGISAATNDVGIATSPEGHAIAMVVFVADSKAASAEREAVIAKVAKLATSPMKKPLAK